MKNHIAYICAGSNQGKRAENCKKGIDTILQPEISLLLGKSGFYKTEPVDYRDQDWFVNIVIKIETCLDPIQLLKVLKQAEHDAGRKKTAIRFGPRILDLDIILYDDETINTSELVIPHPKMHKRCFVLKPLCDIDPDIVHPVFKKDMCYLLDNMDNSGQKVIPYKC